MTKKYVLIALLLALATSAGTTFAQQAPAQIQRSALSRTSVTAGDLKITVKETYKSLFGSGPFFVEVEVENGGRVASAFDPQRLSFVRADGLQIDVQAVVTSPDVRVAPRELLLVGGARSKQTYVMNGKLNLPAKMYYQGSLLAEIVE